MVATLSVVIPIYNESECIGELVRRLDGLRTAMSTKAEMDIIFVDDGSRDDSVDQLLVAAATRPWFRIVKLSRNFGHQLAVTAGLDLCNADYVCIIDADMQDPPELIEPMFDQLVAEKLHIVYGQRRHRAGETWFKTASAAAFYRVLNYFCDIDIPPDTGDFRIIDRTVVEALRTMREHNRFIRGLIPWMGFSAKAFLYDRDARHAGETKYPLRRMLRLAANAIFAFSNRPLRIATWAGLSLVVASVVVMLMLVGLRLFTSIYVPGITFVITVTVMLDSFVILMLGLQGEYLGRVFEQVKGRPLYFVDWVHSRAPVAASAPSQATNPLELVP